jgi:hypothetical protein
MNGRGVQGWHIAGQCKDIVSFEGRGPYFVSGFDGMVVQTQNYCVFETRCGEILYMDYYDTRGFSDTPDEYCKTCQLREILRAFAH